MRTVHNSVRSAHSLGAFAASFSPFRICSTLAPRRLRSSRVNWGAVKEYPSSRRMGHEHLRGEETRIRTQAGVLEGDLFAAHWESREIKREGRTEPGLAGLVVPAHSL